MLLRHFEKSRKKLIFFENFDLAENSLSPRKGEFQRGGFKGELQGEARLLRVKGGNPPHSHTKKTEIPLAGAENRVCARQAAQNSALSRLFGIGMPPGHFGKSRKKSIFSPQNFDLAENSLSPGKSPFFGDFPGT